MNKHLPPKPLFLLKVFTLIQLVGVLNCSTITARRRLNDWRAYTSINRNGMFYTLPGVPKFDQNGLWRFHDIFFSAHGNLKQTAIRLVQRSARGLDSHEISTLVGLPTGSSYLSRLRDIPDISREWRNGRWIYLAGEDAARKKQMGERSDSSDQAIGLPSAEEAVDILVCFIRHPKFDPEGLARQLGERKSCITAAMIRNLLEHHGLSKKNVGYRAIRCLTDYISQLISGIRPMNLFPHAPVICFSPTAEHCPVCGGVLHTLKTRCKGLITLAIGFFKAKETILVCPRDGTLLTSEELRRLSPTGCKFGFDVLVNVGQALFVKNRGVKEIVQDLSEKNITISEREVAYLGRKFIIYLSLAHLDSHSHLKAAMQRRGGYILHIDGTCEGGSPILFAGLDELSGVVLESVKMPSEHADTLIPFLTGIRDRYGVPLGLVHDMGRGILAAVAVVFPGVADYICHFHFLRDLGKDLLEKEYNDLRNGLKKHRVRVLLRQKLKAAGQKSEGDTVKLGSLSDGGGSGAPLTKWFPMELCRTLIHWILDYPSQLAGYGFPFDRPHHVLYQRLEIACRLLNGMPKMTEWRAGRPLRGLLRLLETVTGDGKLKRAAKELSKKAEVFDALRQALSIARPEGGQGLNDEGDEPDLKTIEQKVKAFRKRVVEEKQFTGNRAYVKMISQIDKYWTKLFADPLIVKTPDGTKLIQPQRTNNVLEQFFRDLKRGNRQREGTASLSKTLRYILKETPLVKNLGNADYMRIILDGCSTLEERFATIDSKRATEALRKSQENADRVSPKMKKLIRRPDFQQKISNLFANTAN